MNGIPINIVIDTEDLGNSVTFFSNPLSGELE